MKSIRRHFPTVARAGLLSAASAYAMADATPEAASSAAAYIFQSYDSNGDGAISPEEFKEKGGQQQTFIELDINQDQRLSNDELARLATRPQSSLYGMRFTWLND